MSQLMHLVRTGFRRAVAIVLVSSLAPNIASAELACENPMLIVVAQTASLATRICAVADRAVKQFSDCALDQTKPLTIEVLQGLTRGGPRCLGLFHCETSNIELIAPQNVAKALGEGSLFSEIPADEFYDSVVAHEIAHALAYQVRQGGLASVVDTEYLAFAMQLEFLSEQTRTEFISRHRVTEPVEPQALNEVVLAFSPALFAIKSWKHFRQPENGCPFIRSLLNGEQELTVPGLVP